MGLFSKVAGLALASAMLAVGGAVPALDGHRAPTFEQAERPAYDGFGRKKPRPKQPTVKGRDHRWRSYAAKVVSTHSFNEDPRDDKYLHSHARRERVRKASPLAA